MFFFQVPRLPEMFFSARGYQTGLGSLVKTSRPGTFSKEDLDRYRKAWEQPGAVTAMINWYRALLRRPFSFRVGRIRIPTLLLWGKRDSFLLPSLATVSTRRCDDVKLIWFEEATHWVHHEEPEAVNSAIVKFFGK